MIPGQLAALAVVCVAAGVYYYNPAGLVNGPSGASHPAGTPLKPPPVPPPSGGSHQELRASKAGKGGLSMAKSPVTAAGGRLFKAACAVEGDKGGNVVVSPLSVVVAMSMAAAGATEGHAAGKEIREAMGHDMVAGGGDEKAAHAYFEGLIKGIQSSDPKVETIVANSVWAQGDVLPAFKQACESSFGAQSLKLAGAGPINDWVGAQTKGMIKKLLEADPVGPAVLLNAVYFKGEWQHKFDAAKTTKGEFRDFSGGKKGCDMMQSDSKKTLYAETSTSHLVMLPYGSGRFTGVVSLPKEEGPQSMAASIEELFADGESFTKTLAARSERHVVLSLPRFKVDYGPKSLKDALKSMGVKSGFTQSQGFLRMTNDPSVFIDDVLHKAVIEVNEQGTEAAAATAVRMTRSLPPPPIKVSVDRPFVFAVHDSETNTLLFVSRVVDPEL
mmetsp:Transcript_10000/g.24651  ORF Transcript_10000/g.24651 Transcript_10000/m.24651 type:complete len:443 (+) Transcript_10000:125-1453(+)